VAGEANPVLLFAHRYQDAAKLRQADELGHDNRRKQQGHLDEIENQLGMAAKLGVENRTAAAAIAANAAKRSN
jgi:hypothetical protein